MRCAKPSSARAIWSTPLSSTATAHSATTPGKPSAPPGASRGSATSCATSVARVSAVGELAPATGMRVRLSSACARPPMPAVTKAAKTETWGASAPSGEKASKPMVSTGGSAASAPVKPANDSRAHPASGLRRSATSIRSLEG